MTEETLSRQMRNLVSFLERVAVSIESILGGSWDFSKRNLGAEKCYAYVAKLIAAMTTRQTSSNSVLKV